MNWHKNIYLILAVFLLGVFFDNTKLYANKPVQFPKKGYSLMWRKKGAGFDQWSKFTIKRFKENDSIFYVRYEGPELQNFSVMFLLTDYEGGMALDSIMRSKNFDEQKQWAKKFMRETGVWDLGPFHRYNDYWTYFCPKVNERYIGKRFTLENAIYAYRRDRDKDEKIRNITPEQWLTFFKLAKMALPLVGNGDTRNMYDIMVDPNNTKGQ